MVSSQINNFVWFKCLSALVLISILTACSGGGSGGSSELLNWTAPSERADGSVLALSEIAGYRVYYGSELGVYENQLFVSQAALNEADVAAISAGSYFLVITTVDTGGRESIFSSPLEVAL